LLHNFKLADYVSRTIFKDFTFNARLVSYLMSNNVCERQIRRITKYRNNSFFVGSPEAGEDFARLQSLFANIKNHALDAMTYISDLFRRIKNTAVEDMENLLAHKRQPDCLAK